MKKMISVLIAVLMTVSLTVGCGTSKETQTSDNGAGEAKETQTTDSVASEGKDDTITIGWAMAYFDHPVYQLLMQEIGRAHV